MLVAYICHVKRLQIYIDEDVDRALAVEARRRRTSKAALIREYVAEHLRQPGPDPVDAFVGSFVGKPTCPRPSTTWFTESTNDLRRHVLLGCTWQRRRRSARHREEVVGQQTARGDDLQPCPGRDLDAAQPALRSPRGGCRRCNPLEHRRSRRARNSRPGRAGMGMACTPRRASTRSSMPRASR